MKLLNDATNNSSRNIELLNSAMYYLVGFVYQRLRYGKVIVPRRTSPLVAAAVM